MDKMMKQFIAHNCASADAVLTNEYQKNYEMQQELEDKRIGPIEMASLEMNQSDNVNHPPHYTNSDAVCGHCTQTIECIDVTRHMSFNLGNAIKYIWRCHHKGKLIEDLEKAAWYLQDEISRLRGRC